MKITKELLDAEIQTAETNLADMRHRFIHDSGMIDAMRQLRALLDQPEQENQDAVSVDGPSAAD
jgi:hypothetical protein